MINTRYPLLFVLILAILTWGGCASEKSGFKALFRQEPPQEKVDSSCSYFYFLWGSNAEYNEQYAEALEAYEKASICDPNADYIAEKIPVLLVQLNRFEEASAWLEDYIKNRPEKNVQRFMLARLKIKEGDDDEAIRLYLQALDLEPENNNIRLRLGLLYGKKGEHRLAESIFKTILETDEQSYFAVLYLARLYTKTGDLALAEKRYTEALELNWSKELSYEFAEFYNLRKEFIQARDVYRTILLQHEEDERAALGIVQTHLFLKESEEALIELKKIKGYSNTPERIDLVRSQILINIGENNRAKDILIDLLKENSLAQAYYLLGVILYEEHNFEKSSEALKKIPPAASEYRESILLQVRMFEESDSSDKSIALLQTTFSAEETRLPIFYSLLASIFQKEERTEDALTTLESGVALYPEDESLLYEYAVLTEKSGDHEKAMVTMKKVLSINPNHADSLNFIGYSWADRNINLEKAYSYIRKALDIKPDSGYIQDSLGWVYYRQGHFKKAIIELEKAIQLEPDDPYIYEHLGDTYNALGESDKSAQSYNKAIQILKDPDKIESIQKKLDDLKNK